jgi:UDP-N-acetylmuramyl pentapeptide synthase
LDFSALSPIGAPPAPPGIEMRRALGTDPEKLQGVGHRAKSAASGDLFLPLAGKTFVYLDHVGAAAAHQMVMVAVLARHDQFVARHAIPKIEPLDHPDAFQQMQGAINGGQIAVPLSKAAKNLFVAQRVAVPAQNLQDGLARPGDLAGFFAQIVGQFGEFGGLDVSVTHKILGF